MIGAALALSLAVAQNTAPPINRKGEASFAGDKVRFDAALIELCPKVLGTKGVAFKDAGFFERLGYTVKVATSAVGVAEAPGIKIAYLSTPGICHLMPSQDDAAGRQRFAQQWTALVKRVYPDVELTSALTEAMWIPKPIRINDPARNLDVLLIIGHTTQHDDLSETYIASVRLPKD